MLNTITRQTEIAVDATRIGFGVPEVVIHAKKNPRLLALSPALKNPRLKIPHAYPRLKIPHAYTILLCILYRVLSYVILYNTLPREARRHVLLCTIQSILLYCVLSYTIPLRAKRGENVYTRIGFPAQTHLVHAKRKIYAY